MSVSALRGAITVDDNTGEKIVASTLELLEEMLDRNDVAAEDVVFVIFTATDDLTAEFPAAATRKLGLSHVPVICARELGVDGSLERVVRVMMLINTDRAREQLRHVYLREARQLRTDLPE
ncbi:MAG: chorismate mutase [Candidatus Anoxymicrobium japonicum]|uniref:chorismate mutase n=1 Tax=Candidatus Anoxymicrobium japonicum TaxID=2013648 RepID=A0A2N3G5W4_9ACTN|nr:MAG: chorismate mutase [Candidatus Anoxymicrobium japonicum]